MVHTTYQAPAAFAAGGSSYGKAVNMTPGYKEAMPGVSMQDLARATAGEGIRFEYEILRARTTMGADNVVQGVKGITDDQLTSMARKGWRAVTLQFAGRKLVAVAFERPVK